ncbi:Caspase Recruitment Domain-Containing Protein 14 [Manis pentadactyla]|nr:Caspase Recruitment Domain-Containing Protein 14 [Manis pentadactyla]
MFDTEYGGRILGLSLCLRYGMTDIEADGVGSGECEVESQVEGVIGDINDEGENSGPWIGSRVRFEVFVKEYG